LHHVAFFQRNLVVSSDPRVIIAFLHTDGAIERGEVRLLRCHDSRACGRGHAGHPLQQFAGHVVGLLKARLRKLRKRKPNGNEK
jgi:hypothetical protein